MLIQSIVFIKACYCAAINLMNNMSAQRLIEQSKRGRPEQEGEQARKHVFVAFVPGIFQPQPINNALFRACVEGVSLRKILESGDYRNDSDPLRAMVTRGNMKSNVLTRDGWLRPDRDNMGAFVEYIRDACALDFLVGVCCMPASQFGDLQLTSEEYVDLGITLEDVKNHFRNDPGMESLVWRENKRMVADVNRLQIVAVRQIHDSPSSSDVEEDSDAAMDAYIQSLVRDASKIKE